MNPRKTAKTAVVGTLAAAILAGATGQAAAATTTTQIGNTGITATVGDGEFSFAYGWWSVAFGANNAIGTATQTKDGGCNYAVYQNHKVTSWYVPNVAAKDCTGLVALKGVPTATVDKTPPAVPSALAVKPGDGQVALTWNANTEKDLAGYRIFQDGKQVADIAAGTTSATVKGLIDYKNYGFTVAAYDKTGNVSAQSRTVIGTPVDLTAPDAPASLTAKKGDRSTTLSWTASTAKDLASYKVYANGRLVAIVPAGTTKYTAGGLLNYIGYNWSVSALDVHGNESSRTPVASATPVDQTPPAVPGSLVATPGDGKINLSWTPATDADLDFYNVYLDGKVVGTVDAGTATKYTVSGLDNYTDHDLAVSSVDNKGNESAKVVATAHAIDLTAPAVPTTLTGVPGESQAALTWAASPDADLAGYHVYMDGVQVADVPAGTTEFTVPGLVDYTAYQFTVSAYDENGNESKPTAVTTVTPVDLTAPAIPGNVTTTAGESQVALTWTASADTDVAEYHVFQDGRQVGTVPVGTTTYTVGDLTDYQTYGFTVAAADIHGNISGKSIVVTGTPVDLTAPVIPASLTAVAGDGQVSLNWAASPDSDLAGYNVYQDGIKVGTVAAGITTLDVQGLTNYQFHDFTVAAFDTHGNESAQSAVTNAAAVDLTAPALPTGLVTTPGESQVNLSWNGSPDSDVAGYAILVDGKQIATVPTGTTSYLIPDLSNYTDYQFSVVVTDVHGNSSVPTAPVTGTPVDLTAPEVPGSLTVTPGDSTASLTWTASAATDLVEYRVYQDGKQVATVPAGTTSVTVKDLANGTGYEFTVSAVDVHGNESTVSATAPVTPVDQTAPAAPGDLTVSSGAQKVDLTWTAPSDNDVAEYRVYQDGALVQTLPAGTTSVTINNLVSGTGYQFDLVAVDRAGNESARTTVIASPAAPVANLAAPTGVTSPVLRTNTTPNALTFGWKPVDQATGYQVQRSADNGQTWTTGGTSTTPSFDDAAFGPGTTYLYRVAATANGVTGPYSAAVSVTTAAAGAIAPVTIVSRGWKEGGTDSSSIPITWASAPGDVVGNTIIGKYRIWTSTDGVTYKQHPLQFASGSATHLLSVSGNGYLYYQVQWAPNTGTASRPVYDQWGPLSTPQIAMSGPVGVPTATITTDNLSTSGFTFSWNASNPTSVIYGAKRPDGYLLHPYTNTFGNNIPDVEVTVPSGIGTDGVTPRYSYTVTGLKGAPAAVSYGFYIVPFWYSPDGTKVWRDGSGSSATSKYSTPLIPATPGVTTW